MKSPFPWFGGKSRAASLIWSRIGNVVNYIEPFAGSLAVLLQRPHRPQIETINDIDAHIANFWRAVKHDPQGVVEWATWPVNETDLHARHKWLLDNLPAHKARLLADMDYYCSKSAGLWVWGISCWIGQGWCEENKKQSMQLPMVSDSRKGITNHQDLIGYFIQIQKRLEKVRVCSGDFERILSYSVTSRNGLTGAVLDPPYADGDIKYATDPTWVSYRARIWALDHGSDPLLRIALCGYEGEHEMPADWECVPWKANGGYANQDGGDQGNARRERIWFSPHCLKPDRDPDRGPGHGLIGMFKCA